MNLLQSVILGIVQGLTEFLPVSSSGHLVLLQSLFGIEEPSMTFEVALHLGTLLPVFVVFWRDIFGLVKKPFQKMTLLLVIATIPAVVVALVFDDLIDSLFAGTRFLAVGFVITGVLLILADKMGSMGKIEGKKENERKEKKEDDVTYFDALFIGCVQAVAITPGISRSGSTITGAVFRGLDRGTAAKFSFLMSIPAILGAAVLQVKDIVTGDATASIDVVSYGAGFVAAALSGYLAIRFMLTLVRKAKLKYFSIYVFALAIILFFIN